MAIQFKSEKTIIEVLNGTKKDIIDNIQLLADDFKVKTGRTLNSGCSACVNEMVLTLKNIYQMTQFRFKRNAASYKDKKGDKTTISNSTMTDEKAIAFLKTDPERIGLFSEYPSNWKDLIKGAEETEEAKGKRLAIEAEMKAAEEAKENTAIDTDTTGGEALERDELMKIPLKELRQMYPDIKDTSISGFVDKVLAK